MALSEKEVQDLLDGVNKQAKELHEAVGIYLDVTCDKDGEGELASVVFLCCKTIVEITGADAEEL